MIIRWWGGDYCVHHRRSAHLLIVRLSIYRLLAGSHNSPGASPPRYFHFLPQRCWGHTDIRMKSVWIPKWRTGEIPLWVWLRGPSCWQIRASPWVAARAKRSNQEGSGPSNWPGIPLGPATAPECASSDLQVKSLQGKCGHPWWLRQ